MKIKDKVIELFNTSDMDDFEIATSLGISYFKVIEIIDEYCIEEGIVD